MMQTDGQTETARETAWNKVQSTNERTQDQNVSHCSVVIGRRRTNSQSKKRNNTKLDNVTSTTTVH